MTKSMSDAEEKLAEIQDAVREIVACLSDYSSSMLEWNATLQSLLDEIQYDAYSKIAAVRKQIECY